MDSKLHQTMKPPAIGLAHVQSILGAVCLDGATLLLSSFDERKAIVWRDGHQVACLGGDWTQLSHSERPLDCAVLFVERLEHRGSLTRLRRLRARMPHLPLVLITTDTLPNAKALRHVVFEEVVWIPDVWIDLPAAIRRALDDRFHLRLAHRLTTASWIPKQLRFGLALACRAHPPLRSVNELARATSSHRTTLSRHWRSTVCPRSDLRLQDFLDWMLLLRCRAMRNFHPSWKSAASALQIHEDTLQRVCRRLTNESLSSLAAVTDAEVSRRFAERLGTALPRDPIATFCTEVLRSAD
jgi:hypothetical protein